mmetsp:Transcript_20428/g.31258  ORF Transcript_20428/g.31258 Transcript_20428/m.31258 type:complete len:133 (-) Transcript_20428:1133-1531(-)
MEQDDKSIADLYEKPVSFQDAVARLEGSQAQTDVTVPFYFICILHLANEKGLKLDSSEFGLSDFTISSGSDSSIVPNCVSLPESAESGKSTPIVARRAKRANAVATHIEQPSDEEDDDETVSDDGSFCGVGE